MLLLIVCSLYSKELSDSDWLHLKIPGTFYIGTKYSLELLGVDESDAMNISMGITIGACLLKEYDDRKHGVSSKDDLELDIISIVATYYIDKGVKSLYKVIFN